MVKQTDFSHLPPHKVEQAKLRASLVAEFAGIPRPTRAVAALYAERLGIGIRMFYNLVRIYRERGDLAARRSDRSGSRLRPAVEEIISAEIASKGLGATAPEIADRVAAHCAAANLPIPSVSVIRNRLLKGRRGGTPTLAYPALVLVSTAVDLNILVAQRRVAAWLTLLLHTPTATLLGHHVSAGSASVEEAIITLLVAAAASDKDALVDRTDDCPIPILLRLDDHKGWEDLIQVLEASGLKPVTPGVFNARTADVVVRVLGDRIGWCVFKPRMPPEQAAPAGGPGVELELANSMIEQAIAAAGLAQPADVPQIRGNAALAQQLRKLLASLPQRS